MRQPAEVDDAEEQVTRSVRLVRVDEEEWKAFQKKYGKGRVSRRIRELVREDLERG